MGDCTSRNIVVIITQSEANLTSDCASKNIVVIMANQEQILWMIEHQGTLLSSCQPGINLMEYESFAVFLDAVPVSDSIDRHFLHFEINGRIRKVSRKDGIVDSPALNKIIRSVMRNRVRL
ncbi:hypothetical protein CEXT_641841 [Caerostris extrusa]|uniref:Uncharacterized protein n=1 Tax=Caerostris extrusa TaxID=172846 RepID=A0AAV4Q847_CAEEX|nr:hypothetical protein CEXT_641841 [Caerostris extrusa]